MAALVGVNEAKTITVVCRVCVCEMNEMTRGGNRLGRA
ncbi:hypothetical protein A2U01_0079578, partial [Trifolium medium]|nr:hypothetical protein [Trifolium medium]